MRAMFITIGLLLLAGGMATLVESRTSPATKAAEVSDTADVSLGYSEKVKPFFGYGALICGGIALVVGFSVKGSLMPSVKPTEQQDDGRAGGWQ